MSTLYQKLFEAYRDANSDKFSKQKVQDNVNEVWKALKEDKGAFPKNVEDKITELIEKKTKRKAAYLNFFTQQKPSNNVVSTLKDTSNLCASTISSPENLANSSDINTSSSLQSDNLRKRSHSSISDEESEENCAFTNTTTNRQYTAPAQDALKTKISYLEKKLIAELEGRDAGLALPGVQERIDTLRKNIKSTNIELSTKISKAKRQKKYRDDTRKIMLDLKSQHPDAARKLKVHEEAGRPRLESTQPELLKAITEIAMFGGAAQDRRRSDLIKSCKTLDELHAELLTEGYEISRSATYIRVIPRDSSTAEGKRHVKTVPVKFSRAQNNARKDHPDGKFCTASIRSLETIASILGSKQVAVLSQDDKSRVPIGLTAANKQAPLLMHVDYIIRLADHDWVIAPSHKLIPSVYAGIKIEDGKIGDPKNVTYSGPTYVAIRSAKHCSSTAASHAYDFKTLLNLESFKEIFYDGEAVKPVLIIMSDGGPDENPRYQKVIAFAIDHFRSYNLDAIFVITNAPGRSAYNRVERRMAKFSNKLAGLVLPHDFYGSHLNSSGVTINEELEKRNMEFAGKTLAEVWNGMQIDGYPVTAECVTDDGSNQKVSAVSDDWYTTHVQESQYLLQVVKCDDRDCCGEWRSSLKSILPMSNGFLPPPFPLRRAENGSLVIPAPEETTEKDTFSDLFTRQAIGLKPVTRTGFPVPYDFYCPTLRDEIEGRTCELCGVYFASKKQKNLHKKAKHGRNSLEKQRANKVLAKRGTELLCQVDALEPTIEWYEEDEVDINSCEFPKPQTEDRESIVIDNLHDWLVSAFSIEDNSEPLD